MKNEQDIQQQQPRAVASSDVLCRACGYSGPIDSYDPCMSPYNDCRCPKCGSTNNQHNENYQSDLFSTMKKT